MKMLNGIGSSATTEAQLLRTDRAGSVATSTAAPLATNAGATADSANLSTVSLLVQQSGGDDVRYEKVASIRNAIQAGTYAVSAAAVADKLLQCMAA